MEVRGRKEREGGSSRTGKGDPGRNGQEGQRETQGEDRPREDRRTGGGGHEGRGGGSGRRRTTDRGRRGKGEGRATNTKATNTTTTNHATEAAHETQPRTPHEKPTQGARRSTLDPCLKEPKEGDCLSSPDRAFQWLGAMYFIDLVSERLTNKLLLAPLVL